MPRIIEVTVSPKGETTIQTKGFLGRACEQASKWLEKALGITRSEQKTPEFYHTESTQQEIKH